MDIATMRKRGSKETISRQVCVTSIRILRSGVRRKSHAPFWSSGRRSDPPIDCNRYHGTDRNRNGRKVRRTACFSKDWQVHNAVTYFTMYSYNFCWPVRTLRVRQTAGGWQKRTPAMAAGLADHVWSLTEWLTFPVVQLK